MKSAFLMFVFSVALNCQDDFNERVYSHAREWGEFLFDYMGCPDNAFKVDDCRPSIGHIDRKKFRRSCLSAADLYKFKDKGMCDK